MQPDLAITGGTIIDGTGRPGYRGDVAVKNGRIASLGGAVADAREIIDARGKVVCPGFVDIHTHYDAQILWDRKLSISPWHGVTTVVIGNCGFGLAPTRREARERIVRTLEKVEGMSAEALRAGLGPDWPFESFPEYMDVLARQGQAINVAVLAGHTPIRTYVMGAAAVERPATGDEITAMCALVREAADAGALGFATSHAATHHGYEGHPVPSRLASVEEIASLVAAMAEATKLNGAGRGLVQATVGRTLFHDQFMAMARNCDVRITWTALLSGLTGPGSHRWHLEKTREQLAAGLAIVPQVGCRPILFDFNFDAPFFFEMLPLFKKTMQTDRDGRRKIYADADFREAFRTEGAPDAKSAIAGWTGRTDISYAPGKEELEGRTLRDVADERGQDPVDAALDLSLETDFQIRFRLPLINFDEDEVAELLQDPNTVLALSDAGAHASQLCDACYSTHLLSHWVREKGTLELERAIHMLTQRPAEVFGITDRGLLAEGRPADVVVFDPDTVGASPLRRVWDLPTGADRLVADAFGIDAVICNGQVIRRSGADIDGAFPGILLRGGAA